MEWSGKPGKDWMGADWIGNDRNGPSNQGWKVFPTKNKRNGGL